MKRLLVISFLTCLLIFSVAFSPSSAKEEAGKLKPSLGQKIFFDTNLSNPIGQSCASCHAPSAGFSDPEHQMVTPGADGSVGLRNAPAIGYVQFVPARYYHHEDEIYIGGLFLDGRSNTLEDQASGPFFNPVEMNLENIDMLAARILSASYYPDFRMLYGDSHDPKVIADGVYEALASFQRSSIFNAFTSKYDYYLKGEANLTDVELRGLDLFSDTSRAKCANCHILDPDSEFGQVLLTDHTYDNIGVPANSIISRGLVDKGLGSITGNAETDGQFRVPTLRNIDLSPPYFHNGIFSSLEEVVHFYNARDLGEFEAPEIGENINMEELGNLQLTTEEELAIVAFLKTLTDGYESSIDFTQPVSNFE